MHARGRAQLRAGRNRPQQADLASDQHGRLRGQHARLAGCDRAWPSDDAGDDVGASVRPATMGSRRGVGSARSSACVTHSKNKLVSLRQTCRGAAHTKEKGGVSSSPGSSGAPSMHSHDYCVAFHEVPAWRSRPLHMAILAAGGLLERRAASLALCTQSAARCRNCRRRSVAHGSCGGIEARAAVF